MPVTAVKRPHLSKSRMLQPAPVCLRPSVILYLNALWALRFFLPRVPLNSRHVWAVLGLWLVPVFSLPERNKHPSRSLRFPFPSFFLPVTPSTPVAAADIMCMFDPLKSSLWAPVPKIAFSWISKELSTPSVKYSNGLLKRLSIKLNLPFDLHPQFLWTCINAITVSISNQLDLQLPSSRFLITTPTEF